MTVDESFESNLSEANQLYLSGQLSAAKKKFQACLALSPNEPRVLEKLRIISSFQTFLSSATRRFVQTNVCVIYAWGASGSVFLQSLFDNHPETLMFPATLISNYNHFWKSVERIRRENPDVNIIELGQIFIQYFEAFFDGSSQPTEYMFDSLGANRNQAIIIDKQLFIFYLIEIWRAYSKENVLFNRKTFFVSLHYAYSMSRGEDLSGKHLIIYPLHSPENYEDLESTIQDFPTLKVIVTYRHSFKSIKSNLVRYVNREKMFYNRHLSAKDLILEGIFHKFYRSQLIGFLNMSNRYSLNTYYLLNQDLHSQTNSTLQQLIQWMGIDWDEHLLESTFNGLLYWNDKFSPRHFNGFSRLKDKSHHAWKSDFDTLDRYVFGGIAAINPQVKCPGKVSKLQRRMAHLLLFIPTKIERKAVSEIFVKKQFKDLSPLVIAILERYIWSLKFINGIEIHTSYKIQSLNSYEEFEEAHSKRNG